MTTSHSIAPAPIHSRNALLRNKIIAHLPIIDQKTRMRELKDVLQEATARGNTSSAGFMQLASDYAAQSKARLARLESLRATHAKATTPDQRKEVIAEALRSEQAPRRAFAAVKRGWLDLDAMVERTEFDRHALAVRQSLALRAAAALSEERADRETVSALLEHLRGLLHELDPHSTMCAMACAEALTELLGRIAEWPETLDYDERWEILCGRALQPTLPRRVRAALARLCLEATPSLAMPPLEELLRRGGDGEEFILRQHVVTLLGHRGLDPQAFALLTAHTQRIDASEHVRLALPAALRATGGRAAVPVLEALAGARSEKAEAMPELAAGIAADASPRVRAATAIALAEFLRLGEADTTAALAHLAADRDPIVLRIVAEEIEDLARQYKLAFEQASVLIAALARPAEASLSGPARRALEALGTISDAQFSSAEAELVPQLRGLAEGAIIYLPTQVEPMVFGRLLARLARDGLGFNAWPVRDGYCVERGVRFVRRTWRVLHELRKHTPYKRQDAVHSVGRLIRGTLRAPSGLLAEATPTAVPGEPLAAANGSGWGAHLPTVDDLLSLPILSDEQVTIFGDWGTTQIQPPRSLARRLWARLSITPRYATLAELRQHSLEPADPSEANRYVESLADLGIGIQLRPYAMPEPQPSALLRPAATPSGMQSLKEGAQAVLSGSCALLAVPTGLADFGQYLVTPAENTVAQLGVAAALAAAFMLSRNVAQRAQIHEYRNAIPLCIGGWGTRGKSGTERLKAALMHSQDLNVLTKTTGCEAMFIHGVPGRRPTEIFIHRSYDKATIWEQRDLLALAARLKVNVFLWECMGLSGPLVKVLSEDWMRDDLQTLTNAYPDHEDIQGPAGHDVARSIAGFIRSGGTTITSEDQMLPILESEAQRKHARLIALGSRDHLLLGEDMLARFPYREHPRNIALVRRLAMELGLDPDLATADMAEHVVADLGVLKAYPTISHRTRRIIFVNGMSANERTGFLSNWQRTGCERAVDQQGRWVVTVVNNRFDRVARSQVFADILVRDAVAERHILIGTNLSGLRTYIDTALTHFLPELRLFREDDPPAKVSELLVARFQRIRHHLRIGPATPAALVAELSGWLGGENMEVLRDDFQEALAAAQEWANSDSGITQSALEAKLLPLSIVRKVAALRPELGDDLAYHVSRSIARRAMLASLEHAAINAGTAGSASAQAALSTLQDRMYRELFKELVIPIENSDSTGDQIIDAIARACPPGIEATVMGIQNIKGTGLDFAYRFIRYEEVKLLVDRLAQADARQALAIVDELLARRDFGLFDATLATQAVKAAAARLSADSPDVAAAAALGQAAARLDEIRRTREAAIQPGSGKVQRLGLGARLVEKTFDTVDAVRRRYRADAILDALVHREISHELAALEARKLVDREKKGWLGK